MKKYLLILFLLSLTTNLKSQSIYFPPLTGNNWDTLSPTSLGWCLDKIDTLLNYLDVKNSKAFILLKDGKIVIEKYFDAFTKDSLWYWASAGKTLTAFTVGIAQQEGYLSIYDTTSKYLGQGWTVCPPTKEALINIRHQLTMTTGLDDGVPNPYCSLDTCLQYLADAGTRWAYHNGPYTLLGEVITSTTEQSLNQYFASKVRNPIGMNGAFIPIGYNNVYFSNARSMARFGLLILNKGNWDGIQILTDTAYFNAMVNTSQSLNESYGYLWWLNGKPSFMVPILQYVFNGPINPNAPNDMFAALGKNGQLINVVPSMNLIFIRIGEAPESFSDVSFTLNDEIWEKLNDVMCNQFSIENITNEFTELKLFPNPSQDFCTIELSNQQFDLTVLDFTGRIIYQKQDCFDKIKLRTKNYQNGIYFIQTTNEMNEFLNQKLVISK